MPLIDIYPEPFTPPSSVYRWPFIVDIIPTDMLSARRTNWLPRTLADGVEKLITQAVIDENESNVGQELTIDLANPADRTAFTSDADIDFGIGKKISNAWHEASFLTLLENASTQRVNYTIAGQGAHTANDRAQIIISSAENDKLLKTSESGLILYDPTRTSVSDTDANPVEGFTTEKMPISGMTLEDILDELVERMGFAGYVTDLPADDYPIQRVDIPMGQPFWSAIAPHIAMFYPSVRVINDVIHIHDTTIEQPQNFPAPYEVTLSVTKDQLNLSQEKQKLDGLFLTCTALLNNYDVTDFDFQYPTEATDTEVTNIVRCFVRFWKRLASGALSLVRSELNWEESTTLRDGIETENSTVTHEFNHSIGQVEFIRARGEKLMPDLPDGGTSTLRQAFEDREQVVHQAHPFRTNQIYVALRAKRSWGLINVDADNPNVLGDPARLASSIADRSSWSAVGQTYDYGRTESRTETSDPLRDGNVRVNTKIVDEVRGRVSHLAPQIRAGEIGINNQSRGQKTIPVFAEDNTTRSTQRMDSLDIKELPLKYGRPLARRILRNRQTTNQNVTLPVIGYDPYLQKGALIAPKDRDGVSLGNYIITGRRITINRQTGLTMDLQARQVANAATTVTVQSSPQSSQYGLLESTSQVFPLQIACDSNTYLSIDPSAVSDLSIEAKESTQGSYTDLEAGTLSLPFSGTRTIQVRITAGAIAGTQPVRRIFDLITNAVTSSIEIIEDIGEQGIETVYDDDGDPLYDYVN